MGKKWKFNPRRKLYVLLKRDKETGEIKALRDLPFMLEFSRAQCLLFSYPNKSYEKSYKEKFPDDDVFLARVGSKNCPIIVDMKTECYRYPVNCNFSLK